MNSQVLYGADPQDVGVTGKKPHAGLPLTPRRGVDLEKFTRSLDEYCQQKIETEKARMVEKYCGKDSQTNLFKKFLDEKTTPPVGK